MSSSIYNIETYSSANGKEYKVDDIVKHSDGKFYYCIKAHDNPTARTPSVTSEYWNGTTNFNVGSTSAVRPYFFWTPSYEYAVNSSPTVRVSKFGDGYEQRVPDGINNSLLKFTMAFNSRREEEATAVLHFLSTRNGQEAFVFYPPKPYNVAKLVIASDWNMSVPFLNNYKIDVIFNEVSN